MDSRPINRRERYIQEWNSYIDELQRLRWNLHNTDNEEARFLISRLKELVLIASKSIKSEIINSGEE